MATPTSLTVPECGDIPAIIALHRELEKGDAAAIDFTRLGFAVPSGMVLLAHILKSAKSADKIRSITGYSDYDYSANVGFYQACGFDIPRHEARGGETYYPVTTFTQESVAQEIQRSGGPIGEYINHMVARPAYLITRKTSGNFYETVKYALREIVRNVAEHSKADYFTMCGQYWPNKRSVQVAIADCGIGIVNGLKQNPNYSHIKSDKNALRLALFPATSGKRIYYNRADISTPSEPENIWENSGFGLYILSQIAKTCGKLFIGSGDSYIEIHGARRTYGDFGIPGTFIFIDVDIDKVGAIDRRLKDITARGESFAKRYITRGAAPIASASSKRIISNGARIAKGDGALL